jgi:DnaJ homolog subfamily B member 12
MESNKDEALRCLAIAQKHLSAGNTMSAQKFCQKSINLFSTPEAAKLLSIIESDISSPSASSSDGTSSQGASTASGAEAHASASETRRRHTSSAAPANGSVGGTGAAEKKREYTAEQHAVVKRVRACKITDYYEILSVKKDCEEVEIKKAYRKVGCYIPYMSDLAEMPIHKLALALHPDKNGAPGADEAFKSVSCAILTTFSLISRDSGVEGISSIVRF